MSEFDQGVVAGWRETDLAWAAGFLDGEGHFRIAVNRSECGRALTRPIVIVAQIDARPLLKLQEMFGGKVATYTKPPNGARHTTYRWVMSGGKALRQIIPPLIPHLVLKREQAELLLRTAEMIGPQGTSHHSPEHREARVALATALTELRKVHVGLV